MKYEFNGSCKFCMNQSYYCHVQAIANLSVDSKVAKAVAENSLPTWQGQRTDWPQKRLREDYGIFLWEKIIRF